MINLIKAEWFRIRHSNMQFFMLVSVMLLSLVVSFIPGCLTENVKLVFQYLSIGMIISCMLISQVLNEYYNNHLAFYEIMNGNKIHEIVLSKFAVYVPIVFVVYIIPFSVLSFIFFNDSIGFLKLVLVFIVFLRMITISIGISMILKSADGAAVVLVRLIVELMMYMMSIDGEINVSKFSSILKWFSTTQCSSLGGAVNGELVIKIIVGLVTEAAFLFTLVYFSYKKKWVIDLKFK